MKERVEKIKRELKAIGEWIEYYQYEIDRSQYDKDCDLLFVIEQLNMFYEKREELLKELEELEKST